MENSDHILYNSSTLTSAIVLDCMRLMRNNNNNPLGSNPISSFRGVAASRRLVPSIYRKQSVPCLENNSTNHIQSAYS